MTFFRKSNPHHWVLRFTIWNRPLISRKHNLLFITPKATSQNIVVPKLGQLVTANWLPDSLGLLLVRLPATLILKSSCVERSYHAWSMCCSWKQQSVLKQVIPVLIFNFFFFHFAKLELYLCHVWGGYQILCQACVSPGCSMPSKSFPCFEGKGDLTKMSDLFLCFLWVVVNIFTLLFYKECLVNIKTNCKLFSLVQNVFEFWKLRC